METPEIKAISKANVHMICSAQVILSPAIALKELLENAIDAGATNVEIKLVDMGARSISVADNGSGVKERDFQALTAKHHTSKLSDFTDLDSVETFGFRGEALSSLCAVGKLTITTRHKDAQLATRLDFDSNGAIICQKMESRPVGTSVLFEDIFSTFPVRQKELMRNLKREFSKLVHILQSYGLAAKDVRINALNFKQGKKTGDSVMSTSGKGHLKENVTDIFGPKQAENLAEIQPFQVGDFTVEGFVSTCQHGEARSKPDRQFFFVNNRPCDLKNGSKSLNEIFHQFNRHQYPFCAILISTKTIGSIDVNLTPDKRQIFIEKENVIWEALKNKLKELYDKIAPPEIACAKLTDYFIKEAPIKAASHHHDEPKTILEDASKEITKEHIPAKKQDFKGQELLDRKPCDAVPEAKFAVTEILSIVPSVQTARELEPLRVLEEKPRDKKAKMMEDIEIRYDDFSSECSKKRRVSVVDFSFSKMCSFWRSKSSKATREKEGRQFFTSIVDSSDKVEKEFSRNLSKCHFTGGKIIGQFNLGFIIANLLENDLFIVDQHATDEKYRFETLVRDSKITSQPLVCPQELDLGPGKKELLKDNIEAITRLGFDFDDKLRLIKVPHCDRLVLSKDDLDEILYVLAEDGHFIPETYQFSRLRTLFASRACRTAVMVGTALTKQQMSKIINHMAKMDQPWNCPHGRPTLRHLVNLQMLRTI